MSRLLSLPALMAALAPRGITHPAQLHPSVFRVQNAQARQFDNGSAEHARVMNAWTVGNPAVAGMGFTVSVYEQIVARSYDVLYPEIEYTKFLPAGSIDTSINPGAKIASARVRDWRGKGAFRAVVGKDIPTVGVAMGKISVPLEAGGISAHADLEDIRAVAAGFEGMNLLTDLGAAMRLAYERHREYVFFFGFSPLGFDGYLNSAQVSQTTAGTKAAGGTTWAVATPAEIVKDVTTAIATIITQTRNIFRPNRIVLPLAQWLQLTSMNIGGTSGSLQNESVLSYLERILTRTVGGPIEIVPLRYLSDVGVGGTARMIVELANDQTLYMPDAVPFNMLPPQDDQFSTYLYGDYKFGGLLRPQPRAALYMDGI